MKNFIDEANIFELLDKGKNPSRANIEAIIQKSLKSKGLLPAEAAVLLNCEDEASLNKIFDAAKSIKEQIYGNRLVLFAPLYLSNRCVNNCLYCGFRQDNRKAKRSLLKVSEIIEETKVLISQGHKRLLLVAAEDPAVDINYLEEMIKAVYGTKNGSGSIRRANVNVAPMSEADFKRLKKTGIGTYQLFQETYHQDTYKKVHPSGPKAV